MGWRASESRASADPELPLLRDVRVVIGQPTPGDGGDDPGRCSQRHLRRDCDVVDGQEPVDAMREVGGRHAEIQLALRRLCAVSPTTAT